MCQTEEIRITLSKHFVSHTHPSHENPMLIDLENHSSNITYEVLDICKKTVKNLVSFPRHCSHA